MVFAMLSSFCLQAAEEKAAAEAAAKVSELELVDKFVLLPLCCSVLHSTDMC